MGGGSVRQHTGDALRLKHTRFVAICMDVDAPAICLELVCRLGDRRVSGRGRHGLGIGSGRLLYVNIVPPDKRTDYMALYYAWTGIVGGISQLGGGRILDYTHGLSGHFWIFSIDPFLPLFVAGIILPFVSFFLLSGVHEEQRVTMGQFAGIFLRGNPFLAMSSMIRYHLARDEHDTVLMTERLGQAKSPLTVDELLEALEDPRFNVRFEAIISIARMMPDPRLIEALEKVLEGSELALTVVAAWALGRLGDKQAIEPLRRALDSDYRSVRAHSARALGTLEDVEIAPILMQRLGEEQDKGLLMAYASALGNLHTPQAIPMLLRLLSVTENEKARMELALTLARLVGDEHEFIQLLRDTRGDAGTAMAQTLAAFKKKVDRASDRDDEILELVDTCANYLAHEDLAMGGKLMGKLIDHLPKEWFGTSGADILAECANHLEEVEPQHIEYIILALHILQVDRDGKR